MTTAYAVPLGLYLLAGPLAVAACIAPARSRRWLRTRYRLAWFRLTRRMPRYKGRPEPGPVLSFDDKVTFAELVMSLRSRERAPEPEYAPKETQ